MFEGGCQDQELIPLTANARNLRHHSACLFQYFDCWDVDEKVIHLVKFVRAMCLNHLVQSAGESPDENFRRSLVESDLLQAKAAAPAVCFARLRAVRTDANPVMFRQVTVPSVRQSVARRTAQALSLVWVYQSRFADLVFAVRARSFCCQWLSHRSAIVDAADFEKKFSAIRT